MNSCAAFQSSSVRAVPVLLVIVLFCVGMAGCNQDDPAKVASMPTADGSSTNSEMTLIGEDAAKKSAKEIAALKNELEELTTQLEAKSRTLDQTVAANSKLKLEIERLNYQWNSAQTALGAAGEELVAVQSEFNALLDQSGSLEQRITELRKMFAGKIEGLEPESDAEVSADETEIKQSPQSEPDPEDVSGDSDDQKSEDQ